MKVLVTGDTSGLGRNAVEYLRQRGISVRATGRKTKTCSIRPSPRVQAGRPLGAISLQRTSFQHIAARSVTGYGHPIRLHQQQIANVHWPQRRVIAQRKGQLLGFLVIAHPRQAHVRRQARSSRVRFAVRAKLEVIARIRRGL